jgi:hypothetical protein
MNETDLRVKYLEDVMVKVLKQLANMSNENKNPQPPKGDAANNKKGDTTGGQPPVGNTDTTPVDNTGTPVLAAPAYDVKYQSKMRRITQADVDSDSALREFLLTKHPDIFLQESTD